MKSQKAKGYSHKFFENLACEYHPKNNPDNPCHHMERINCTFCFCALFWTDCPNPQKTCVTCTFPHDPDNYDKMMQYLAHAYDKAGISYDKSGKLVKHSRRKRTLARE